jgi:hypothetical protein
VFCSATATWLPVGVTGAADSEHASSSYRMIINQTSSKLPAIEERPATAVIIHMTPRRSRHPCCWAFPFSSTARLPRTVSMRTLGGHRWPSGDRRRRSVCMPERAGKSRRCPRAAAHPITRNIGVAVVPQPGRARRRWSWRLRCDISDDITEGSYRSFLVLSIGVFRDFHFLI